MWNRRRLLQLGSIGLARVALPDLLRAEQAVGTAGRTTVRERPAARAKSCILLYTDGGASHVDLFDQKPLAPAEVRGPFQPIPTSVAGIHLCEHLPRLARQMHHVLQIRSMRHEETVHDPAVYQMLTGFKHVSSAGGLKVEESDHPHLGSALTAADPAWRGMPTFIHTPDKMKMESRILPGQKAGVLPASFDPFAVDITNDGRIVKPNFSRMADETPERLRQRQQFLRQLNGEHRGVQALAGIDGAVRLDRFREQACDILCSTAAQAAFDLERETPETHDRYGRHRHGQCVLLARRLVEAGCRLVTVYWGNEEQDWADGKGMRLANNPWDTHRNHFPLCKDSLLPRADQALAALLDDLHQRGMLAETLVVWMGDFGRTPYISKPWASRDHWPHAFTVLLAGGQITGGAIYGRTDNRAAEVTDRPVTPADLTATIVDSLGVNPATTVRTKHGQLHRLSTGRVLSELFGSRG